MRTYRNLRKVAPGGTTDFPASVTIKSGLQCKICLRSYRLFFVADSEDFIYRRTGSLSVEGLKKVKEAKKTKFEEWIESKQVVIVKDVVVEEEAKKTDEDVKMDV